MAGPVARNPEKASDRAPGGAGRLPNLLVIGAAKAGTTSLHRYLDLHPEVFMSRHKELKFFNRPEWRDEVAGYRAQFPVDAAVRGESSPIYSMHPWAPGVPERVHALIPEAKLIYLVRDPVERLLAQYVEFYARRLEDRSLEEALADRDESSNVYVMSSRYAYQLDRYRELFPDSQILVLDQRDLLEARRDTLRRVFRFLDVDADFSSPQFDAIHNVREERLRANAFGWWLSSHGWLHPLRRRSRVLPAPVRERLKSVVADRVEGKPVLDEQLRRELEECVREDAARLRVYTGRTFAHWSV